MKKRAGPLGDKGFCTGDVGPFELEEIKSRLRGSSWPSDPWCGHFSRRYITLWWLRFASRSMIKPFYYKKKRTCVWIPFPNIYGLEPSRSRYNLLSLFSHPRHLHEVACGASTKKDCTVDEPIFLEKRISSRSEAEKPTPAQFSATLQTVLK